MDAMIAKKVDVALAEYNTLRNEISQRNTLLNNYLVATYVTLIAAIALLKDGFSIWWFFGAVIFAISISYTAFKIIEYDTLVAASRVSKIEQYINSLIGEDILLWENRAGLLKVGYTPRWKYIFGASLHDPLNNSDQRSPRH